MILVGILADSDGLGTAVVTDVVLVAVGVLAVGLTTAVVAGVVLICILADTNGLGTAVVTDVVLVTVGMFTVGLPAAVVAGVILVGIHTDPDGFGTTVVTDVVLVAVGVFAVNLAAAVVAGVILVGILTGTDDLATVVITDVVLVAVGVFAFTAFPLGIQNMHIGIIRLVDVLQLITGIQPLAAAVGRGIPADKLKTFSGKGELLTVIQHTEGGSIFHRAVQSAHRAVAAVGIQTAVAVVADHVILRRGLLGIQHGSAGNIGSLSGGVPGSVHGLLPQFFKAFNIDIVLVAEGVGLDGDDLHIGPTQHGAAIHIQRILTGQFHLSVGTQVLISAAVGKGDTVCHQQKLIGFNFCPLGIQDIDVGGLCLDVGQFLVGLKPVSAAVSRSIPSHKDVSVTGKDKFILVVQHIEGTVIGDGIPGAHHAVAAPGDLSSVGIVADNVAVGVHGISVQDSAAGNLGGGALLIPDGLFGCNGLGTAPVILPGVRGEAGLSQIRPAHENLVRILAGFLAIQVELVSSGDRNSIPRRSGLIPLAVFELHAGVFRNEQNRVLVHRGPLGSQRLAPIEPILVVGAVEPSVLSLKTDQDISVPLEGVVPQIQAFLGDLAHGAAVLTARQGSSRAVQCYGVLVGVEMADVGLLAGFPVHVLIQIPHSTGVAGNCHGITGEINGLHRHGADVHIQISGVVNAVAGIHCNTPAAADEGISLGAVHGIGGNAVAAVGVTPSAVDQHRALVRPQHNMLGFNTVAAVGVCTPAGVDGQSGVNTLGFVHIIDPDLFGTDTVAAVAALTAGDGHFGIGHQIEIQFALHVHAVLAGLSAVAAGDGSCTLRIDHQIAGGIDGTALVVIQIEHLLLGIIAPAAAALVLAAVKTCPVNFDPVSARRRCRYDKHTRQHCKHQSQRQNSAAHLHFIHPFAAPGKLFASGTSFLL